MTAHTASEIAIGACIFVVSLVGTTALAVAVVGRLPPAYFIRPSTITLWADKPRAQQIAALVAKNLLGGLLVLAGALMSLPGIPGQGFLTIMVGVFFLDFPGKLRFEQRFARSPRVFSALNKLRARQGKAPFEPPPPRVTPPRVSASPPAPDAARDAKPACAKPEEER